MELQALVGPKTVLPANAGTINIAGLTADSREVRAGFLFAALPGVQADGAKFIPAAIKAGAAAILAEPDVTSDADVPVINDRNPRRRLAMLAAQFYGSQPDTVAAVTGTNGKTSVATFVREIWASLGLRSASLGTVGVVGPAGVRPLAHTTPDPVRLHSEIAQLAGERVTHLALEASSHGLAQYRLDGVRVSASAFTNLTRDHLDYHANFDDYLYAKMRLFGEVMDPGGVAVINVDADFAQEFEAISWARGHQIVAVGRKGRDICLAGVQPGPRGQVLQIVHGGAHYEVMLPLVGQFQASNALVAAGLVIGCGGDAEQTFRALENLKGAKGRLEEVAHLASGATVFIDYAHTPDALETALEAVRPHVSGKLIVVFGCGGDRDAGKRPQMGKIASQSADITIVTDDNPRSEEAAAIRQEVLAGANGLREVGDRALAISEAVSLLQGGDCLVVAGKGHETGQIVGDKVLPFSDHEAVATAVSAIEAGSRDMSV
ncbi:MAG: UDP-N-acetylmuramoyl-L-alanyl-D-glutamate--2,6-diaminopimelate ligase [Rhodobiaceae bacterium]|nr:UDP-N-acetylmuramoyl-L-alanyl-D-glutamate--2,6-diaminopimelate ligase [Rhodobiaceae bacterium]